MSSTRWAKDDSAFRQDRYASSPEFERGLLGNMVAKRVSKLDDKADRELIWFLHFLSHGETGLAGLIKELVQKYPKELADRLEPDDFPRWRPCEDLERFIKRMCLDPGSEIKGPSYFENLLPALREYRKTYIKNKSAGFTTELGKKVCEVLDYTAFSSGLTLMPGEARTGKSFAARLWCEQHPGAARFVEVPPFNDDSTFFRALARGLGLGNFLKYKVCDIRERVQSVLLTRDLLLVLDEAQRLWPQGSLRRVSPCRIDWVMGMANQGVPIAMISTPQFIEIQKALEKNGWNGAQFTGRIKHYEPLPADLSPADLIGVAKSVLPEADGQVLRALAIYARSSARYLAAIDSISTRARYLAMKDSRSAATTADVRKAMQESVIPADNKLHIALELGRTNKRGEMPPARPLPVPDGQPGAARSRSVVAPLITA